MPAELQGPPTEIQYFPSVNLAAESERGKFATLEPPTPAAMELTIPTELSFSPLVPLLPSTLYPWENRRYRSPSPEAVLTTIRLYGRLGKKFGRVHKLAVETPAEAMNALDTLFPGFRAEIRRMTPRYDFTVKIGEDFSQVEGMYLKHSGKEIRISPVLEGRAGNKGTWELIGGAALIVVGIVVGIVAGWTGVGLIVATDLIIMGVGLLIGGIAALLSGTPSTDASKSRASYQFGGAQNVVQQGAPAALAYGKVFCGSVVGSSSIDSKDVAIGSDKTPGPNAQNANFSTGGVFTEELGDGSVISVNGRGPRDDGDITDVTVGSGIGTGQGGGGGASGGGGGLGGVVQANNFPERTEQERRWAMGAGGGGASGEGAKEDPDSLESREYAKIVDIVGEGPIRGLVDGQKSIYFNGTPIQNADGTFNFQDYELHFLSGTQDQDYIPHFDTEEATQTINFPLKYYSGSNSDPNADDPRYVSSIDNENLDAIRINLTVSKLVRQDKKSGDVHGTSVSLTIELACGTGPYVPQIADTIKGKTNTAYTRSYLVKVPATGRPGPYRIRVTRLTENPKDNSVQNFTNIESVTQIVYVKLKHPNTVKAGLSFDAEQFPDIPTRTYYVYGLMIRVPKNYDPDTRVYATTGEGTSNGEWDGTFKTAWTCNPSWILWDILTQNRYGLGEYLKPSQLDKWAFYAAARYCDQQVPDGYGGTEARYECHAYIAGRQEALRMVSDLAGIMRAAAAYISGTVVPVMDRFVDPSEYLAPFGPANVINGDFSFSNASRKARHNVALVQWNDPADMGNPKVEYVENPDEIAKYGIRELNISPLGCYSRGQAHRQGRWALLTEEARTEIVSFQTGFEGAGLLPGDVLPISVPTRAGRVVTGRLSDATATSVVLDRSVTLTAGNAYTLMYTATDGSFQQAAIADSAGTYTTLHFTTNNGHPPSKTTTWILKSTDLEPELFRILTVSRQNNQTNAVTAVEYNPSLYDAIEKGFTLEKYPTSVLPSATSCEPPTNLNIGERAIVEGTGVYRALEASWQASPDTFFRDYQVKWRLNAGNWVVEPPTQVNLFDLRIRETGTYEFMVTAFNKLGAPSLPLLGSFTVADANPLPPFVVGGLELFGNANGTEFGGRDISLNWQINSPGIAGEFGDERYGSGSGGYDPSFQDFEVRFYRLSDGKLVYAQRTLETQFTLSFDKNAQSLALGELVPTGPYRTLKIDVVGHDKYGNETLPTSITATNPIPPKLTASDIAIYKGTAAVMFQFLPIRDRDFAGIRIYASATAADLTGDGSEGFVPAERFHVQSVSSDVTLVQAPGTTMYYRFGAYDSFSASQFLLSDVIPVTNDYVTLANFAQDFRDQYNITATYASGAFTQVHKSDGSPAGGVATATAEVSAGVVTKLTIVSPGAGYTGTPDVAITGGGGTGATATATVAYGGVISLTLTNAGSGYAEAPTVAITGGGGATMADQLSAVYALVGNAGAIFTSNVHTVADLLSAHGTKLETLTANVGPGPVSATLTMLSDVLADNSDPAHPVVKSLWGIYTTAGNHVGGITLLNDGTRVDFTVQADVFKIVSTTDANDVVTPFQVSAGAVVVGVDFQSDNYIANAKGYRLRHNGKLEINVLKVRNPQFRYSLAAPTINPNCSSFFNSATVQFSHSNADPTLQIHYSLDGSEPNTGYPTYTPGTSITIGATTVVKAMAFIPDPDDDDDTTVALTSPVATAVFVRLNP